MVSVLKTSQPVKLCGWDVPRLEWHFLRADDASSGCDITHSPLSFFVFQERGGNTSFTHDSLTLKYKLDNQFELVFVVRSSSWRPCDITAGRGWNSVLSAGSEELSYNARAKNWDIFLKTSCFLVFWTSKWHLNKRQNNVTECVSLIPGAECTITASLSICSKPNLPEI